MILPVAGCPYKRNENDKLSSNQVTTLCCSIPNTKSKHALDSANGAILSKAKCPGVMFYITFFFLYLVLK